MAALKTLLDQGLITFNAAKFDEVAALASRLIARRSDSFRSQYGFKLMRKTNIALCRLNEINMVHTIEELLGNIPIYQTSGGKFDLPTRDNFDYVLVRLQSLAALLFRIARCARESSNLFLFYVHRNFFLETSVISLGVLAEVWQVSRRLCYETVQFYNQLHPYARHFGQRQNWLPQDVELPRKLEEFLGVGWTEEWARGVDTSPIDDQLIAANNVDVFFGNRNDQDMIVELPREKPKAHSGSASVKPTVEVKKKVQLGRVEMRPVEPIRTETDVGEVIERQVASMNIDKIVSTEDIQKYVKSEKVRLTQGAAAMSLDKWKDLQRKINHILVTSQGRNTVQMFKKFWSMAVLKKTVR